VLLLLFLKKPGEKIVRLFLLYKAAWRIVVKTNCITCTTICSIISKLIFMHINRKKFLLSFPALATALSAPAQWLRNSVAEDAETEEAAARFKIPPYLRAGDTIGITCPAGFIKPEDIVPAVQLMESWGFTIKAGATVGAKDFTYGGTDAERLQDLQAMLDDENVKAVMCARGGYGAIRIIDQLDFTKFKKRPKWIIGFSDITVLHSHINSRFKIASIHSKMCNSFPADWNAAEPIQIETINSIRQCLGGEKMQYSAVPDSNNRLGEAAGVLVGGNLKTIETMAGSSSDLDTKGKILFVEDTGEKLYSIDRMFWNLLRSGKLNRLKGLLVGGFKMKPDEAEEPFGKTIEEIVLEKIKGFGYPVCFDFPVGHQKNNFALKCGVRHRLLVSAGAVRLEEE
jgi:muramoyltetrapeptide carboxypeptidase